MYRSDIILLVFCLCALSFVFSTDPIFYAVDLGDPNGLILLKKISPKCPYYKSLGSKDIPEEDIIYMRYFSDQWEIIRGPEYRNSQNGCWLARGTGENLFTHEGEDLGNGTWFKVLNNNYVSNFSVYALEDCTTYAGAFISGDFGERKKTMTSRDPSDCPTEANNSGQDVQAGVNIFTTMTKFGKYLTGKIVCKFEEIQEIGNLPMAYLRINKTDENARVIIPGRFYPCSRSAKIVNIDEARIPSAPAEYSGSDNELLGDSENSSIPWIWIYVGSGAVGVMILGLAFCCIYKCLTKKERKGGKLEGNYGRASIDSNLQYGVDKEYYQYQYDKKQTRVVDANEMYTSYDYQ